MALTKATMALVKAKAKMPLAGIKGGGFCWLITSVFGAPRDLLELLTLSGLGLELSDLTGLGLCLDAAHVYLLIT